MPTGNRVAAAVVLPSFVGTLEDGLGRYRLAVFRADFGLGREIRRLVRGQSSGRRLRGLNRCNGRFSRVGRRERCRARDEHSCTHGGCVKGA